jgi:hypothetical protein
MPNWCKNTLQVSGPAPDVKRFRDLGKKAGYTDLSLHAFYPLPGEEAENWYNWCTRHWGTKWDIDAELKIATDDYLEYSFESAWAPPDAWLEEVSKQFPALAFRLQYDEPDQALTGVVTVQGGIVRDEPVISERSPLL